MSPREGTPLIHPDLWDEMDVASVAQFYPDLISFETPTQTVDDLGQAVATWAVLTGPHPCRIAPVGAGRSTQELHSSTGIWTKASHQASVPHPLSNVTTKDRAVIGVDAYDIEGIERDGSGQTARLALVVVTP